MEKASIERAARLIADARKGRTATPDSLPADCAPADARDAHAIQDRIVELLGESVVGWKVGQERDGIVMRGAVISSRLFESPALIPATLTPLRGIEAEIAFRFDEELPQRSGGYNKDEVAAAVTALVAIEVVDSRFRSYHDAAFLDKAADFISNGALVTGTPRSDWRSFDLSRIEAVLTVNGEERVRKVGGHVAGEPIRLAVALVNDMAGSRAIPKGAIMTTGTYTGISFLNPGDKVVAEFIGFGQAELTFVTRRRRSK